MFELRPQPYRKSFLAYLSKNFLFGVENKFLFGDSRSYTVNHNAI